ncbi:hypothetical protein MO973_44865 [Paenibacillus sp. TRM 82003]|uniref:hypothetical protein n=1 Tax=Kineococcus sp. TRM81007 TaxID=2925831 RepID=UPI001F568F21|nr:hypothetical protein [Kineococcus sp. TRM81007]MCI2238667.1 hypothetical protein [Kineococcus sp. TRM81007]MCI3927329.1 hypothetical protein [Paenibacillus sp. TRM 82003]
MTALTERPAGALAERLLHAKRAFSTRHVDLTAAHRVVGDTGPLPGDVVLARVSAVGQHKRLESPHGRRAVLFPGDEVVVAYGHRYAPDQFEAVVPSDLGPCELVAAGGLAARVQCAHTSVQPATSLEPVGLLADAGGHVLNLRGHRPPRPAGTGALPPLIAVVGASMNSGKTTTAAALVRGLTAADLRVGAAKATGTGAGGDLWLLTDSGARPVVDFTDAGLPSTYRAGHPEVLRVFTEVTDALAGCDLGVVEIADGVFQDETARLVTDPLFRERVGAVVFAAGDALGAVAGVEWMRRHALPPLAVSGVLTASPLAVREARVATGVPVWDLAHLTDPAEALATAARLVPHLVPDPASDSASDPARNPAPLQRAEAAAASLPVPA